MLCCHFVPKKNLVKIKREKFLKPQTPLYSTKDIYRNCKRLGLNKSSINTLISFAQKLPKNKFIVAIPQNRIKDWVQSGLIKEILYFIKPSYVLEFNAPKNSKIYVREHIYQSPKEVKQNFHVAAYEYMAEPYKTSVWIKYFKSTKMLKSTSDLKKIKVPEVWISGKVPTAKIKIRKLSSVLKY